MKGLTLLDLCLSDKEGSNPTYQPQQSFKTFDSRKNGFSPLQFNNDKSIIINPQLQRLQKSSTSPVTRQIDMMMEQLGVSSMSINQGHSDYLNQNSSHNYADKNPDFFYRIDACHATNQEYVSIELFRDVIFQIQQRLLDYEARLENKEHLEHINNNYQKQNTFGNQNDRKQEQIYMVNEVNMDADLQVSSSNLDKSELEIQRKNKRKRSSQKANLSDLSQNSNSPSRLPHDQEFFYGRIQLFDKKFKQLEDKIGKQSKEDDEFKRDIQKKIDISLKKVEESLGRFSKQGKDMVGKFDEMGDAQKQIMLHLSKLKDDKQLQTVSQQLFQQQTQDRQQSCEGALTLLSQLANNTSEEFQDVKFSVSSLEMDLILILKNYKDMLFDVSRNQLLKQDVECLQHEFKQIVHQVLSNS